MESEDDFEPGQPIRGFTMTCNVCGSDRIRAVDNIGYGDWTGRYGRSYFECQGCDNEANVDNDGPPYDINWEKD